MKSEAKKELKRWKKMVLRECWNRRDLPRIVYSCCCEKKKFPPDLMSSKEGGIRMDGGMAQDICYAWKCALLFIFREKIKPHVHRSCSVYMKKRSNGSNESER